MPVIETTIEIAQPPEVVAEAFLDPDNAVYWTKDLERFEVISGGPGEIGSVAHLHYAQKGRTYIMVDVLEDFVPNRYFKSRIEGAGLKAQVETWLKEIKDGTEVTIRWSGSGSTLFMRLLLPFMRGAILRHTKNDLEKFKNLVETHGANFSR